MPADIEGVEDALMALLTNDAALRALVPDGVWWDEAPYDKAAFVILSGPGGYESQGGFQAAVIDRPIYLVKSVIRTKGGPASGDAAKRIHELLHHGTLAIAGTGYGLMIMERVDRVRYSQREAANPANVWQHRGGRYGLVLAG